MNKVYKIENESLTELLDQLDQFSEKMDNFRKKHSHYNYEIEINGSKDKWTARVKIDKHEENRTT